MDSKLTDEEVWLRIYCAAIGNSQTSHYEAEFVADMGLKEFKAFREANKDVK